MSKLSKTLMGGLLLACLCFALPATAEAASAKSAASERTQITAEKPDVQDERNGAHQQQVQERQVQIQRSTQDGTYLKGAAPSSFSGYWRQTGGRWWFQLTVPFEGYNYLRDAHVKIEGSYYYFDNSGYMVTGWYQSGGYWYYFNASGAQQFGWEKIGSTWYYLDPEYGYMYADEWLESGSTRYYLSKSGAMAVNTWLEVLYDDYSEWYFYGADGLEVRGWQKIGGEWYYFDPEYGYMYSNYWMETGDTYYYLGEDGAMYANEWLCDWGGEDGEYWEYWYYYDANGLEVRGWQLIGGKWYYFDPDDGDMWAETWVPGTGDTYYWVGEDGAMYVNKWMQYEDGWYYYGADGKEYRGWNRIGASWYYFEPNVWNSSDYYIGQMHTGWLHLDEKYNDGQEDTWYYLGKDGAMRTGWVHTDEDGDGYADTWYYQGADGRGYTHWHKIGGVWYHFGEDFGEMYADGYLYLDCENRWGEFAASGAWIRYVPASLVPAEE